MEIFEALFSITDLRDDLNGPNKAKQKLSLEKPLSICQLFSWKFEIKKI